MNKKTAYINPINQNNTGLSSMKKRSSFVDIESDLYQFAYNMTDYFSSTNMLVRLNIY